MTKRLLFSALLLFTLTTITKSQFYTSGEDPASVRWQQINTQHFKVVFPSTFSIEAQRFASLLEKAYPFETYSIDYQPKPITVIIHSKSSYSNGFVTWAPRRMEIFPTPHQGTYAQDWLEQLALHESRHLVQISSLNRGFTKFAGYLYGQMAVGAVAGAYIPMWYFEGDATLTETLLSESGRGRQPSFEMELRAQLMDKGRYSYDKAYLGSYADYVPNYYVMGYHLVTGARQRYGADFWANTIKKTGANSWWPFIFSHEIKQQTGLNKVQLYESVFDSLQQTWKAQDTLRAPKQTTAVTAVDERFKNYLYSQLLDNGNIIAEVTGPGEVSRFVTIKPNGKEETLHIPGYRNDEPFSIGNNKLIWSELQSDIRWEHAKRSVVKMMDLSTGKVKNFVNGKTRLFSPALSQNGKKVAMIRLTENNQSFIDVADAQTSAIIQSFSFGNDYLYTPSWSNNNATLALIRLTSKGKQIITLNTTSGEINEITQPSFTEIQHPVIQDNTITYSLNNGGKHDIYQIDRQTLKLKQLTDEKYGAYFPKISQGKLYYSRYTANGYQLINCDTSTIVKKETGKNEHLTNLYEGLEKEEAGKPNFDTTQFVKHEVKPYSKWNLLNFHSWAPTYVNLQEGSIHNGVTLMSQNMLGTLTVEAGYNADPNYRKEKWTANISYKAWFPVLDLKFKAGDAIGKDGLYTDLKDTFALDFNQKQYYYQLTPSVSVPLNLSRGAWSRYISPSIKYNYYNATDYQYNRLDGTYTKQGFIPDPSGSYSVTKAGYSLGVMEYDLFGYNLRKGSSLDVDTRWGQVIELNYRNSIWGTLDQGSQMAIFTKLYFPGIGRHHAIKLQNDFQWQAGGDMTSSGMTQQHLTSIVTMPRGYALMDGKYIYSLKTNYNMPLMNPDFSLGGLFYLKRVTANLFYDFSSRYYQSNIYEPFSTKYYQSIGTELMAEIHVARFLLPIGIGGRFAYLPEEESSYSELLISLNLSGFMPNRNR